MESKRLSFNLKLIKRDVLGHWPVWVTPLVLYILTITLIILSNAYFNCSADEVTKDVVRQMINISGHMSYILGFVAADMAFGFLGSKKKDYFFEALPMNRMSLFVNRFLYAYILMFIPNLIISVIEIIQIWTMSNELVIMPIVCWLLIIAAQNLFWLAFGTLCMVLCGRKLMAGICYVAFAFLGLIIKYTLAAFNAILFVGMTVDGNLINLGILSPCEFIFNATDHARRDEYYGIEGYFGGWNLVVLFMAFAVIVVTAYILYTRRKAERTGDNIVFSFMKHVFSWCFTIVFAMEMMFIITGIFINDSGILAHYPGQRVAVVIIIIIMGFIGYMISCMIVEKKFKVFKDNLIKSAICTSVLTLFIILYMHDAFGIERYIPDKEELFSCRVLGMEFSNDWKYRDYTEDEMSDDEKEVVIEFLTLISDNIDILVDNYKRINGNNSSGSNSVTYRMKYGEENDVTIALANNKLYIDIYLKNGKSIFREYYICSEGKLNDAINAFVDSHPEYFVKLSYESDGSYYYEN